MSGVRRGRGGWSPRRERGRGADCRMNGEVVEVGLVVRLWKKGIMVDASVILARI